MDFVVIIKQNEWGINHKIANTLIERVIITLGRKYMIFSYPGIRLVLESQPKETFQSAGT